MAEMLSVAEARARILADLTPVGREWVPLEAARGRVLADAVTARRTQPPAAVSAMDGYAVRAAETAVPAKPLRVVGENRAGARSVLALGPGEAVRIFTGGILPEGADGVALEENAQATGREVSFARATQAGEFVRPAGLDFTVGWVGLEAGTILSARSLGLAAGMGHVSLPVRRRPRIALVSTGDELVRPGEKAGPEQIVSSNALTLAGLVEGWGGQPVDLGIAGDTEPAITEALEQARQVDALVTIGGASIGQYDLVRPALAKHGLQLDFWRLAMRPGKPMMFGRLTGTPVLGLPGNPVSATVCAILFLRAVVLALLGLPTALPTVRARTARDLPANDMREDYLRARIVRHAEGELWLEAAARQDSSMFATLARADALILRPPSATALRSGTTVPAILLDAAERPPGVVVA